MKIGQQRFVVGSTLLVFAVALAFWGFSKGVLSDDQRRILLWLLPLASGFSACAFAGSLSVKAQGLLPGLVVAATGGFGVWLLTFFFLFPSTGSDSNKDSSKHAVFGPLFLSNSGVNISKSAVVRGDGNIVSVDNSVHYEGSTEVPALPQITIETLDGLPPELTNNTHLRLHRLVVRNPSAVPIESFCSRIQLPEPLAFTLETNSTFGTAIGWRPLTNKLIVNGTGGKTEGGLWIGPSSKVTYMGDDMSFFPKYARGEKLALSRAGDITGIWELTFERLPPNGLISILFVTSNAAEGSNYIDLASVPLWSVPPHPDSSPDTNELRYSFEGEYQFRSGGKLGKQHFLVPLEFNADSRVVASLAVQPDIGRWHPITLVFQ